MKAIAIIKGFSKYGLTEKGDNVINVTTRKKTPVRDGKVRIYNDAGQRKTVSLTDLRQLIDGTTSKEDKSKKAGQQNKITKKRDVLSIEDSQTIKKAIDEFKKTQKNATKKQLVISLLKQEFTKQQLDKYRPEIAHWSHIYQIAAQLK